MEKLTEDDVTCLMGYLDNRSKLKLILASIFLCNIFSMSSTLLNGFNLEVDSKSVELIDEYQNVQLVPFRNLTLDFESSPNIKKTLKLLKNYPSTKTLKLKNVCVNKFDDECINCFENLPNLWSLKFSNCLIKFLGSQILPPISSLKSLTFEDCNDNTFKLFAKQESIEKITVIKNGWACNRFPHDTFLDILKRSKKINHLILNGAGNGNYFDFDEKEISNYVTSLEAYHWYVGITPEQIKASQIQGSKEVVIHKLPSKLNLIAQEENKQYLKGKLQLRQISEEDLNLLHELNSSERYTDDDGATPRSGIIEVKAAQFDDKPFPEDTISKKVSKQKLYIYPRGYPYTTFTLQNRNELIDLIPELEYQYVVLSNGRIEVRFSNEETYQRFKSKCLNIAYRVTNETTQSDLLISSREIRILMECILDEEVDGDNFLKGFSKENELNLSRSYSESSVPIEDNKHRILFSDSLSICREIIEKDNLLVFGGKPVSVNIIMYIIEEGVDVFFHRRK